MNLKTLLSFVFPVMVSVSFTSCQDKQEEPEPISPVRPIKNCGNTEFHEIDATLMKQFLFNPGSYWIYQDSITGSIDSCYNYTSKLRSGSFMAGPTSPGKGPCYYYYTCALDSINQPQFSPYMYYIQGKYIRIVDPFGPAAVGICSNNSGTLAGDNLSSFLSSVTIHNVSYTDVYRFHFYTNYWTYKEGYYYLKPGIGILKIELITRDSVPQRKVYELVRYKV